MCIVKVPKKIKNIFDKEIKLHNPQQNLQDILFKPTRKLWIYGVFLHDELLGHFFKRGEHLAEDENGVEDDGDATNGNEYNCEIRKVGI